MPLDMVRVAIVAGQDNMDEKAHCKETALRCVPGLGNA